MHHAGNFSEIHAVPCIAFKAFHGTGNGLPLGGLQSSIVIRLLCYRCCSRLSKTVVLRETYRISGIENKMAWSCWIFAASSDNWSPERPVHSTERHRLDLHDDRAVGTSFGEIG